MESFSSIGIGSQGYYDQVNLNPVGKIAEKAVLQTDILSAELTKTHSLRLFFFTDIAHWEVEIEILSN